MSEQEIPKIPPRIVAPGYSLWLKGNEIEIDKGVFVTHSEWGWVIYQQEFNFDFRVNNQPLIGRRTLKDGDYIHSAGGHAIFQEEPAADYFEHWPQDERDTVDAVELTKRLKKNVVIDMMGISLNGGKSYVAWDDLAQLYVYREHTTGQWSVRAFSEAQGEMPSKFKRATLTTHEMDVLLRWLFSNAPYALSTVSVSGVPLPDAYKTVAWDKLLSPAHSKKINLPVPPSQILGLHSCRRIVFFLLKQQFMLLLWILFWGVMIALLAEVPLTEFLFWRVVAISYVIFTVLFAFLNRRSWLDIIHHVRQLRNYESIEEFRKLPLE